MGTIVWKLRGQRAEWEHQGNPKDGFPNKKDFQNFHYNQFLPAGRARSELQLVNKLPSMWRSASAAAVVV